MDNRIGAQLYTVREFCQTAEEFEESMKKLPEIGQGNLDWDAIIPACRDCEFVLVEQDQCDGDPFDSLKISYDYLSKKGFE